METQECTELPPRAEFLPRLPPARRVAESSPPRRQGQRPISPAQEHLERSAPKESGTTRFEAERNHRQCVSCHTERDCVVCHRGRRGRAPASTRIRTDSSVDGRFHEASIENPRPCFVCHRPRDPALKVLMNRTTATNGRRPETGPKVPAAAPSKPTIASRCEQRPRSPRPAGTISHHSLPQAAFCAKESLAVKELVRYLLENMYLDLQRAKSP